MAIFEIWSTEEGTGAEYVFHGYGEIAKYDDPDDDKLAAEENNDTIHRYDDGSYVVVGSTGNTYADAYEVEEKPYKFAKYSGESEFKLVYDGEDVTKELVENDPRPGEGGGLPDFINPKKLKEWALEKYGGSDESEPEPEPEPEPDYDQPDEPFTFTVASTALTPAMDYTFTVDGSVSEGASLEDGDVIENGTVEGLVGPRGSDSYEIDGTITDFSAVDKDGEEVDERRFEVRVNDEPARLWNMLGEDRPEYEHLYGGGAGYSDTFSADDADYHVSSKDGLLDASNQASSGDVVFIDGDAEIYMGEDRAVFEGGVTVASDRGVNGSDGALVYTDDGYDKWASQGSISVGREGRITGLRVRGPLHDFEWHDYNGNFYSSGVEVGTDGEVDNCEIWGANHLIHLNGDDVHVHHCKLYKANMKGVGYVIGAVGTEGLLMEYCHTYHFRHVVGATGSGGFEARYNIIDGPALAHAYDQHSPGGTYTKVHHNTQRVGDDVASGDPYIPLMTFRGSNVQNGEVYKNWVYNPRDVRDSCAGFTDEFLTHAKDGGTCFENIEHWDNHLGESEPDDPDVGAPRPYNV